MTSALPPTEPGVPAGGPVRTSAVTDNDMSGRTEGNMLQARNVNEVHFHSSAGSVALRESKTWRTLSEY